MSYNVPPATPSQAQAINGNYLVPLLTFIANVSKLPGVQQIGIYWAPYYSSQTLNGVPVPFGGIVNFTGQIPNPNPNPNPGISLNPPYQRILPIQSSSNFYLNVPPMINNQIQIQIQNQNRYTTWYTVNNGILSSSTTCSGIGSLQYDLVGNLVCFLNTNASSYDPIIINSWST